MSPCPDTDSLVAIGEALEWDVARGLQHVSSCPECRAQLEALVVIQSAFAPKAELSAEQARRIDTRIAAAATEPGRGGRWALAGEGLLGGVAAVAILASSHQIQSPGAAVLGFVLGALLAATGVLFTGKRSAIRPGAGHA